MQESCVRYRKVATRWLVNVPRDADTISECTGFDDALVFFGNRPTRVQLNYEHQFRYGKLYPEAVFSMPLVVGLRKNRRFTLGSHRSAAATTVSGG